ncbi:MAG: hypothetical protein HC933_06095 [Pleurocapsa sp. SU_196_0]|nr:hypothetical protein [Pleurocapsa sp. SU_196_0]
MNQHKTDDPAKLRGLGVIDLSDPQIETPEAVAERIRRALEHARPEDIIVAQDCGMKYLPRPVADRQAAPRLPLPAALQYEPGARPNRARARRRRRGRRRQRLDFTRRRLLGDAPVRRRRWPWLQQQRDGLDIHQ